ncbi:hypothetical protein BT63DRAFT_483419 [Microthyrium microscopicum]|uniref:Secreted protein n=1 Tax=Microthyrium microscopicum TaxID=703497 RepID=A0A6A6TXB8_9PEZI|nr:hypothetical protein BT63DRAFT_483419 [Microthyrium microscopicum]
MVVITHATALLSFIACVQAAALTTRNAGAPIPGYGVEEIKWSLPATQDGKAASFHGTVQNVTAQLVKLNPSWKDSVKRSIPSRLVARAEWNVNCNPGHGWDYANTGVIRDGINHLRSLPAADHPQNGPGPGNCGRVSCSYDSAIWWCNDHTEAFAVNGWDAIAEGAQRIVDHCINPNGNTGGQAFNADNWNVVVRKDNC